MDSMHYAGTPHLEIMAKATNYYRFLSKLIQSHVKPGDTVIDFGAGIGTFAEVAQTQGAKLICIEISRGLQDALVDKGFRVLSQLNRLQPGSADCLYAFDVLEHIAKDTETIGEWHEALRPGGRLLVYVPAFQTLYSEMDHKIGHYRRYRLRQLRSQLQLAGFVVERAQYVDGVGFLGGLFYKWFSSSNGDLSWKMVKAYDTYIFPLSRRLDTITRHLCGKNLLVVAHKPEKMESHLIRGHAPEHNTPGNHLRFPE